MALAVGVRQSYLIWLVGAALFGLAFFLAGKGSCGIYQRVSEENEGARRQGRGSLVLPLILLC